MSRFMGGFAAATVLLTAAAIAGGGWSDVALGVSAAASLLWLAVLASGRSRAAREPDADPSARPFGAREERRETVKRR